MSNNTMALEIERSAVTVTVDSAEDTAPDQLIPPEQKPRPFPLDALGSLANSAKAIQQEVQAPASIVGSSTLTAAALAVQHLADIVIDGRRIPLSLFSLTIAQSGDRKSAVDKWVLEPVRKKQRQLDAEYKTARKRFVNENEAYQKGKALILSSQKKDNFDLADMASRLDRLDEPAPPRTPQILISDVTYDGIVKAFNNGQPSQGMFNDEGGSFFGGHAMKDDSRLRSVAGLSQFWDGSDITRTRAAEGESMTIINPRLSCHLMIQPVVAGDILRDPLLMAQGVLARYLMAAPDTLQGTRLYKASDADNQRAIADYNKRLLSVISKPYPLDDEGNLAPGDLSLTDQAKQQWIEAHNAIETHLAEGMPLEAIAPTAAKAAEQILRMAGVLTLLENTEAKTVDIGTINQAIELEDWYLKEALRLHAAGQINPDYDRAKRLVNWLKKENHRKFTSRILAQYAPSSIRKHLKPVLELLLDHRWIYPLPEGTQINGKAVKQAWRLSTHV